MSNDVGTAGEMRSDLQSNVGDQVSTASEAVMESRFMAQGDVWGFGDPAALSWMPMVC